MSVVKADVAIEAATYESIAILAKKTSERCGSFNRKSSRRSFRVHPRFPRPLCATD